MKHVDIYLENTGKSVKKKEGWYGYVLAYQGTQLYTREGFQKTEDTKNERDVRMLLEALTRCKPCEAVIHTESQDLQGTFGRLAHYQENGWKKSDGTEIKYRELWQQVSEAAKDKEITFRTGSHEFTGWIRTEIERREKDDKQRNERIPEPIQG